MADGSMTLVVAWRQGKEVQGRQVKATTKVVSHLQQAATDVDQVIADGGGKAYDPDDEQGDAAYVKVKRDQILDPAIETAMLAGSSLPLISADELQQRRLLGYGLVSGDGSTAGRKLYLRRSSPVQMLSKSLVTRFDGTLSQIDDPVLAFDDQFDVVMAGDDIWALDQTRFEALFKESEAVLQMVGSWVNDLSARVPMSGATVAALGEHAKRNGGLRRKLHSVLTRGHVQNLSAADLKTALEDHGLEADRLMKDGELDFVDTRDALAVVALLNEDFFSGYFSDADWAASRKSAR